VLPGARKLSLSTWKITYAMEKVHLQAPSTCTYVGLVGVEQTKLWVTMTYLNAVVTHYVLSLL